MEEKNEFNEGLQLYFNSPNENPYSGLALYSKISQRSKIIDDLVEGRVDVLAALGELQNCDDSIITELIQESGNIEHWQQEAAKWKQQAEAVQFAFNQFRATHF